MIHHTNFHSVEVLMFRIHDFGKRKKTVLQIKKPVTRTKISSRILSKRSSVMRLVKMYLIWICGLHHRRYFMLLSPWRQWWLLPREIVHLNCFQLTKYKDNQSVSLILFIAMLLEKIFWKICLKHDIYFPALRDICFQSLQ